MSLAKSMREVSVEEILRNYSLVVPEIQREYVWGFNQYGIFETFIHDIREGFESEPELSLDIISLQECINSKGIAEATRKSLLGILDDLKKNGKSLNIGFLYSYKPAYYIGNDREEDLYLIDGQQRFTTLFLVLFYLSIKENRKQDFEILFKFDATKEKIAFDYRVRSITHQFMIDLITHSQSIDDLLDIKEKSWFLSNYGNDVTVRSIVGSDESSGVFNLLNRAFSKDSRHYYDFVSKQIKFWHFQTEETSQGEELYITMNSRGQQLADNENIRAKLFEHEEVKSNSLEWSEKWEVWQDFFWKNRNKQSKDATADDGFNEFLRWVQILKMYEMNRPTAASSQVNKSFERTLLWEAGSKLDVKYLTISDIDITFKALVYLFVDFRAVRLSTLDPLYKYCTKFDLISKEWLKAINGKIPLIELFKLLPVLSYIVKIFKNGEEVNPHSLLRLIRILHSLSKDETVTKSVREQVVNVLVFVNSLDANEDITATLSKDGLSKAILNNELKTKLEIYSAADDRVLVEDLFWFAEDFTINNGEIKHMIDFVTSFPDESPAVFFIEKFKDFALTYKDLIDHKQGFWSDLLGSQVYVDAWDRVCYSNSWHKTRDFLRFVNQRLENQAIDLPIFLKMLRKKFIAQYDNIESIRSEASAKKQLYIYYIAQTELLKNSIGWWGDDRKNFGIHRAFTDFSSVFYKANIYQSIKNNFRENSSNILYVHQPKINKQISLEDLLTWAKS